MKAWRLRLSLCVDIHTIRVGCVVLWADGESLSVALLINVTFFVTPLFSFCQRGNGYLNTHKYIHTKTMSYHIRIFSQQCQKCKEKYHIHRLCLLTYAKSFYIVSPKICANLCPSLPCPSSPMLTERTTHSASRIAAHARRPPGPLYLPRGASHAPKYPRTGRLVIKLHPSYQIRYLLKTQSPPNFHRGNATHDLGT